jgi:AcrR family transcriptional regulator
MGAAHPLKSGRGYVNSVYMTDVRTHILDHAGELYLEVGADGFSMRRLAERVGLTAPAIYRHFESRDALLVEMIRESAESMMGYLARSLAGTTPLDRLKRAGAGYLEFALDHPRHFLLYGSLCERLDPGMIEAGVGDEVSAIGQFWQDRVRECVQTGAFRPGNPDAIGLTLWAHAYGMVSLYLNGALRRVVDVDRDAIRAIYMESCVRILEGIAAPGALEPAGGGPGESMSSETPEASHSS